MNVGATGWPASFNGRFRCSIAHHSGRQSFLAIATARSPSRSRAFSAHRGRPAARSGHRPFVLRSWQRSRVVDGTHAKWFGVRSLLHCGGMPYFGSNPMAESDRTIPP